MIKFVSIIAICMFVVPGIAATPAGQERRTMTSQMMTPRGTSAVHASMASAKVSGNIAGNIATGGDTENSNAASGAVAVTPNQQSAQKPAVVDTREKEKSACMNNNIGMGNTFVWASRYSNANNYATMVEDVDVPDNNTCWVRVELKSTDSKVDVSDVPAQYYEMGRTITCGSWADEEKLKKRILDAKKTARTWGTVGGAVGGAAIGVGAMELFGNKLIGGAVEGQYGLSDTDLLKSQLAVAYKNDRSQFEQYKNKLSELKRLCEDLAGLNVAQNEKEAGLNECRKISYEVLLTEINRIEQGN